VAAPDTSHIAVSAAWKHRAEHSSGIGVRNVHTAIQLYIQAMWRPGNQCQPLNRQAADGQQLPTRDSPDSRQKTRQQFMRVYKESQICN
jgi:hypothetical protein